MKRLKKILAIVVIAGMGACTETQYVLHATEGEVPVYYMGHAPESKNYKIIAHIETQGSVFTYNSKIIRKMKQNAKKIGADAVIDVELGYIAWGWGGLPCARGYAIKWK